MNECISCKKKGEGLSFEVLEVHTTRTRSSKGLGNPPFQTIQTISGVKEFSVCNGCIDKRLGDIRDPLKGFLNYFKVSFIILVFGIIILFNYFGKDTVYTIGGLLCLAIPLLKALRFKKKANATKNQYAKLSENNARFVAAWEVLSSAVPKSDATGKVSFVPVTKATRKMSREELTKYYGLTSSNAHEFYMMMHSKGYAEEQKAQLVDDNDEREPNTDLNEDD